MVLIGISLIVASLSLLCYKLPPSSWSLVTWIQENFSRQSKESITTVHLPKAKEEEGPEAEVKADLDRKAMPPPPPPVTPSFKFSSASTIPTPHITKTPSTDTPSTLQSPSMRDPTTTSSSSSLPAFPALNSVQRASGGRGPPHLNSLLVAQPPLRSVNALSPQSSRSPLPNRSPITSQSALALPPSLTTVPAKPRLKVQLTPGHSPLDWAQFSSRLDTNLRGIPPLTPYLRVPPSLLRQYTGRKGKNVWTALGGKVYNITPYLPYHPGGVPELMKAAGRDGTKIFGEIHPWVNWEGMLESCLIGVLVAEGEPQIQNSLEDMD